MLFFIFSFLLKVLQMLPPHPRFSPIDAPLSITLPSQAESGNWGWQLPLPPADSAKWWALAQGTGSRCEQWLWRRLPVWAGPALWMDVSSSFGASSGCKQAVPSSGCKRRLLAFITLQEQGKMESPQGWSGLAAATHSHWWHWALAAGASTGQDQCTWEQRIFNYHQRLTLITETGAPPCSGAPSQLFHHPAVANACYVQHSATCCWCPPCFTLVVSARHSD